MTFGERLRTLLIRKADVSTLVNERVFPLVLPADVTLPAVRYSVVSDMERNTLSESEGGPREARIQIDCYAKKYLDAQVLADAAVGALGGVKEPGFTSMLLSRRDLYEEATKVCAVSLDFSMWMTEA